MTPSRPDDDHESQRARINRELMELLNEIRIALPGVQLIFGFLVTVPFTSRFATLGAWQRLVFFATFLCTTASAACLIAPSSYHRLRFRAASQNKERMLVTASHLAIAGTGFLALAMVGSTQLIATFFFSPPTAIGVAAGVGAALGGLWFGLPLFRRWSEGATRELEVVPPASPGGQRG